MQTQWFVDSIAGFLWDRFEIRFKLNLQLIICPNRSPCSRPVHHALVGSFNFHPSLISLVRSIDAWTPTILSLSNELTNSISQLPTLLVLGVSPVVLLCLLLQGELERGWVPCHLHEKWSTNIGITVYIIRPQYTFMFDKNLPDKAPLRVPKYNQIWTLLTSK